MKISKLVELLEDTRAKEGDIEVRFLGPYNDYEIEEVVLHKNRKTEERCLLLRWQG